MMERVLITGANRGIGLGIVEQYLKRGDALVFATCRTPEKATELNVIAGKIPTR
jgi:NAD(P)-dependent dehydrogenase (short-subunit alcohol dehydrogenase family)